eukprot:TRINITY_DN975_c0_g1_i1.p1 TRINITY_DN975_c0_g1~~TRINITY_DN975_c0_g1_i1.p1  ORF type:complete len:831 (+),score=248.61 TRINITY_DN975_c0_g1_i1:196-2493(+)
MAKLKEFDAEGVEADAFSFGSFVRVKLACDTARGFEGKADRTWVDVQKKTFTRWANQYLIERMMKLDDLQTGLDDGIKFINLLEVISGKSLGSYNKRIRVRPQALENCGKGLNFLRSEGIRLVGIGPEDLVDHKLKLILGLIWTIILRYQISTGEGSAKRELLEWVRNKVKPYDIPEVKNFTSSWQDAQTLSALTDSLEPGTLPGVPGCIDDDKVASTDRAIAAAESTYGIPRLVDAEDMVHVPDELSIMTYVSCFRDWDEGGGRAKRAEHLRKLRTPFASECIAYGPGLEGGETFLEAPFTVEARNCFGDPVDPAHGGDTFVIAISGSESPSFSISDNGDGKYPALYTPTLPGTLSVSITYEGQDIKSSPFSVDVKGPSAGQSYATGPGVEGANTDEAAAITIFSVDGSGNRITTGGDPFEIVVTGPESPAVQVNDNGDGTYGGDYTVAKPGHYEVAVTLRGEHVKDSPFRVLVEAATAANSYAEGPGLVEGRAGEEAQFTIYAVDHNGNKRNSGGDPFKINIDGPQTIEPEVSDNDDGTYTVTYTPDKRQPGDYKVSVTLFDKDIKDAPFSVLVKPASDAGKSYAEGPGLNAIVDNETAAFTIFAVDPDGNRRTTGEDDFSVSIAGPQDAPHTLTDNNDGTYSVSYDADVPGDYVVSVTLDGENIKDSPFTVPCKAGTDASGSGFGSFSFTVTSKDKRGEAKTFGGDNFDVTITGESEVEPRTVDNGDGSYTATYSIDGPGEYSIDARLNGKSIGGSPFKQHV